MNPELQARVDAAWSEYHDASEGADLLELVMELAAELNAKCNQPNSPS